MTIHAHPASSPTWTVRPAAPDDAAVLATLIETHREEGHLLPRGETEIRAHAAEFVVAEVDGVVRACAALVPLSKRMAEVRSLVVAPELRHHGVAGRLVDELRTRAEELGFSSLLAIAHDPRLFMRHGFSIVPLEWLPEKIARDCHDCPLFRQCGQYAMLRPLDVRRPGPSPLRLHPTAAVA
jgi:amino-acid N-acetyltransferase